MSAPFECLRRWQHLMTRLFGQSHSPGTASSNGLNRKRDPLAAANAHRDQRLLPARPFQIRKRLYGQDRSGRTDGMTKGNRSAIRVHEVLIQPEFPKGRKGLRGESLVRFDHVEIANGQAGPFEKGADRGNRPDAHLSGFDPGVGVANGRASGVSPCVLIACSEARTRAAARSLMPEALPAVTVPPLR